ncbi:MAG: YqaJ viral recombinase family protein, partial [Acidimicrobiales bacterium]
MTDPNAELTAYVNTIKQNRIEQRTPEWLVQKSLTVGGSQIACIQGRNSYCSELDMLRERVGIIERKKTAHDCMATNWGIIFEPLIKLWCELKLNTPIIGDNIYIRHSINTISYSPDGFGVVNGRKFLFEFKCPFSRIVKDGVPPPEYYISQVKYGLS